VIKLRDIVVRILRYLILWRFHPIKLYKRPVFYHTNLSLFTPSEDFIFFKLPRTVLCRNVLNHFHNCVIKMLIFVYLNWNFYTKYMYSDCEFQQGFILCKPYFFLFVRQSTLLYDIQASSKTIASEEIHSIFPKMFTEFGLNR
jgi:hypothetical protein